VRGVTLTSHVEPRPVQFSQAAPFWPQSESMKPGWHVPVESQQPAQLFELHGGGGGTHCWEELHVSK
jgi:hypothetical protein